MHPFLYCCVKVELVVKGLDMCKDHQHTSENGENTTVDGKRSSGKLKKCVYDLWAKYDDEEKTSLWASIRVWSMSKIYKVWWWGETNTNQ